MLPARNDYVLGNMPADARTQVGLVRLIGVDDGLEVALEGEQERGVQAQMPEDAD